MQWPKWQTWRKIASFWQFELDAKRGPLETGDFRENRQRAGDNGEKRPGPLATGDSGEISDFAENRQTAGYDGEKRPGPLETGDLGENGDFGENRHRASLPRRRF